MLLRYFYDKAVAHASYMVGCQKTGEAFIVDPGRDVVQYLQAAIKEKMQIVGVVETHIHADYVSGARELADQVDATLYVSDEGPAEWKYEYAKNYKHKLLKDGDQYNVGNIQFETMHTPGHTPESLSFLLTDQGGGADRPMGLFTGDFVFVGSIGRPDLLEEAAGIAGTAEPGARDLFQSIARFKQLPDYLQIWPAHGAGSACGKGLGAVPSSTVGYEKMFNPALQFEDEEEFVQYVLADQPEAPKYFAVMKRVNKEGPELLSNLETPERINASQLNDIAQREVVIDTATTSKFAKGHVPGTINIATRYVAAWMGALVDYDKPVFVIVAKHELTEVIRIMRKIGIEKIGGYFDSEEVAAEGLNSESFADLSPSEVAGQIVDGTYKLIDVRGQVEWKEHHIQQAQHQYLGNLPESVDALISDDKPLVFQCRNGGRSVIAASIAQARGAKNVINMSGGITDWINSGLSVESDLEPISA